MICKLYRDFTNHTVVNADNDLHWSNTTSTQIPHQKMRNR